MASLRLRYGPATHVMPVEVMAWLYQHSSSASQSANISRMISSTIARAPFGDAPIVTHAAAVRKGTLGGRPARGTCERIVRKAESCCVVDDDSQLARHRPGGRR